MSPRPLLKETDSYRVVIKGDVLQDKDGSDVIIDLPKVPSDSQIVYALKRAGLLLKSVRQSQLTLRDSQGRDDKMVWSTYRIYVYGKREGLLFTLVEAV